MIPASISILRATVCLNCANALRSFSVSSSVLSKTQTKKSYADLPSTYIRPDGTVAEPLGEWKSGMETFFPENFGSLDNVKLHAKKNRAAGKVLSPLEADFDSELAEKIDSRPQTTLAQEILENLRKFPQCLLLTRVGNFYEANEIARLLSIKLTTRKWGAGRVAMCGFPLAHLDKYLKVLVQQNKRFVALCEEFPQYSEGTKTFNRRVSRVVTPGTLIDEPFLNPFENNYLLAIGVPDLDSSSPNTAQLGLAWIDVSTGEFFSKCTNIDSLRDELTRIAPKEVILDDHLRRSTSHPIHEALAEDDNFVSYLSVPESSLDDKLSVASLDELSDQPVVADLESSLEETLAISLLNAYLHANLLEYMPVLPAPNREGMEERMQIDSHTIKALEIREGIREGGTKGSLLSVIKRTITSGGTRLLSRWLCSPSTSLSEINARQSLVAFFHARPHFHADLAEVLANAEDTIRIVQKFTLGRGEIADLLGVKKTVRIWTDLVKRVQHEKTMEAAERQDFSEADWASLEALMSRIVLLDGLSKRIGAALGDRSYVSLESVTEENVAEDVEDRPSSENTPPFADENEMSWRYGSIKWTIKPRYVLTGVLGLYLATIDAPSLTLRVSPAQGMHVHLARAKRDQKMIIADSDFVSIAESASTRCFFFKDWSRLGGQITETNLALTEAEKEAFDTLRNEVNSHSTSLRRNAHVLDELDVALSFAKLATELNFVRPQIIDEPIYEVRNGRHPTVELGLLAAGRVFTPNSVTLTPTTRLHVITGPNMAGKSTFLRQTALIAILAQTGSFVPADYAVLGTVDKLFSRVGAKDDLFHDRSTFMVEMLETADILRRATPKSLVIMDEVGRGTTVTDGLAIAYATLHHLVHTNQCRALFATHFHELSTMLGYPQKDRGQFHSVDFFCTDIDETDDGHFAYQYRLRPGVNRDSHGLKVAQLAGMPATAMDVATTTLASLKAQELIQI
ncbi:hypothetical protein H0H92_011766 [Tricholoma furcatifolium]|nr:hypothetical protein H0H92_011766 [Tricholoma furcatifolium]